MVKALSESFKVYLHNMLGKRARWRPVIIIEESVQRNSSRHKLALQDCIRRKWLVRIHRPIGDGAATYATGLITDDSGNFPWAEGIAVVPGQETFIVVLVVWPSRPAVSGC